MRFFTFPITVRMAKETIRDIEYLIDHWPEKYSTLSQVIRCAVINLVNEEEIEEENENRRIRKI